MKKIFLINNYKKNINIFNNIFAVLVFLLILIPLIELPIYYLSNSDWYINYYLLVDTIGELSILSFIFYIIYRLLLSYKYLYKTLKGKRYLVYLSLLLIWIFFSCIFSKDYDLAFNGSEYRHEGFSCFLNYFVFFIIGMIISNKNNKIGSIIYKPKKIILTSYTIISSIISLMVIYQYIFPLKYRLVSSNLSGVFFHFNHCGYYLAMAITLTSCLIVISKNKWMKILLSAVLILQSSAIIINDTFGGILAVFISLLLIIVLFSISQNKLKNDYFIPIFIFIFVCIILSSFGIGNIYGDLCSFLGDIKTIFFKMFNIHIPKGDKDNKSSTGIARIVLWKIALKNSINHPIFGYGLEQIKQIYEAKGLIQSKPANEYIYYLIATGFGGFLLYISFLSSILFDEFKKIKAMQKYCIACLIVSCCYMISAFFGNSTFYITPYFMIFLGLSLKQV